MPRRGHVENRQQYEALKKKGMSKSRAARIANSPGASSRGGKSAGKKKSRTRSSRSRQGGTSAQKKSAGRKGARSRAQKRS